VIRSAADVASMAFVLVKSLVLVPLYLRSFGLALLGAWLASGNLLAVISVLEGGFTLVYAQGLARDCGRRAWREFADLAACGALILGTLAFLVGFAAFCISPFVPGWIGVDPSQSRALAQAFGLAGIGVGLTLSHAIIYAIFNSWQRPAVAGLLRLFVQVLEIALIVVGLGRGYGIVVLGAASAFSGIVGLCAGIVVLAFYWKRYAMPRGRLVYAEVAKLVRVTGPVFISKTTSVILNNNETFVAAIFAGPAAAAVLGLTDRVFKNAYVIAEQVGRSMFYGLAHLDAATTDRSRTFSVLREVLGIASAVMGVLFAATLFLNPSFVALWVGPQQFGGKALNLAVASAAMLSSRVNVLGILASALGGIREAAWGQLAEILLRALSMVVLLPVFGVLGIPIATALSSLLVGILLMGFALTRALGQPPRAAMAWGISGSQATLLPFAVAAVLVGAGTFGHSWPGLLGWGTAAVAVAALLAVVVEPNTRALLRKACGALSGRRC
jgi:O-antigen/teichoic acid export membrane protein